MYQLNSAPSLLLVKRRRTKLIDLVALIKTSATNWLESMISGVLFVSSQITRKSVIPRCPLMVSRRGVTAFIKRFRVISSFCSNNRLLAEVPITFFK